MNPKIRNLIVGGIILLCVVGVIIVLAKSTGGDAPAAQMPAILAGATTAPGAADESTPGTPATTAAQQGTGRTAVGGSPLPLSTTTAPDTPDSTSSTVFPPTEGEKAAAAVGQEYSAYRPTQGECDQAVESGGLESCVSPDSIQLITRPEWEQLLPDTDSYLIGLAARDQDELQDHSYWRELVAWQGEQYYTAETYDDLLKVNGITTVTDENRELIAKALALMTIPDYLGEEVAFTKWEKVSYTTEQALHAYNYNLQAWTKLGGWEVGWWFVFEDTHLQVASGPNVGQSGTGNYLEQPSEDGSIDFYSSFQDYVFTWR